MITDELLQEINKIDKTEEIHKVWDILREQNNRITARLGEKFYIGQTVHFERSKKGNRFGISPKVVGTILKINQKSCQVIETDTKLKWNVYTGFLIAGE